MGLTILTIYRMSPGWSVTFTQNATDAPRPQNGTFDSTVYLTRALGYFKKTESEKKPFFAYLAFQVAHSPFMSPPELVDKYDKIYSVGWDKIREERFEKQKELGFWPANMTTLEEFLQMLCGTALLVTRKVMQQEYWQYMLAG